MTVTSAWSTIASGKALSCVVLAAAFVRAQSAGAAPRTAPFRLGPGHASRPAFYFVLTTPGTVRVRVDTSRDEPVSVTALRRHGRRAPRTGAGQIAFTVTATRDQMAAGSEWAVIVTGNRTGTTGQGTITVDAPEPSQPQAGPLDTWLHRHPAVAFHLTWNDGERSHWYSAWPAEMRAALVRRSRPPALGAFRKPTTRRPTRGSAPATTLMPFTRLSLRRRRARCISQRSRTRSPSSSIDVSPGRSTT